MRKSTPTLDPRQPDVDPNAREFVLTAKGRKLLARSRRSPRQFWITEKGRKVIAADHRA